MKYPALAVHCMPVPQCGQWRGQYSEMHMIFLEDHVTRAEEIKLA
jgi:hypothetical protein